MPQMTLAEAQLELSQVNIAIQTILEGKKLSKFSVGSGDFVRTYTYTEINIETLRELRRELLSIIASLEPEVTPVFRNNATIPLVTTK